MRRKLCCTASLFVAVTLIANAGSQLTHEAVLKETLGALEKLSATLAGIRDAETAKLAQSDLRKSADQWKALMKKAEELPPPNKEEKEKLEKAYAPKLEEARRKLFGEVDRVRSVAGGREALQVIDAVLNRKPKR